MLKKIYRNWLNKVYMRGQKIRVFKQKIGEWIEILSMTRKIPMKNVMLSSNQKKEIDLYWKKEYGKKISKLWHRKYFAYSEKFDVRFFPEILYTTELEPLLNSDNISNVLSDKSLVEIIYGNVLKLDKRVVIPKTICGSCKGYGYDSERKPISFKNLIALCKELIGEYVIKPTIGESSGHGVRLINLEKGFELISGQKIEEILAQYGTDFIIQEKIEQNERYAAFHKESINTIRLLTYRMEDRIETAPAIMRIGVDDNFLDNAHAGGLYIAISDDGILQKYGIKNGCMKMIEHPNSKIKFEGYHLPKMDQIIEVAKLMHRCVPQIGFINWDFAVNKNNEVVLIESNMRCGGIWAFQQTWGRGVFGDNTEYMIHKIRRV